MDRYIIASEKTNYIFEFSFSHTEAFTATPSPDHQLPTPSDSKHPYFECKIYQEDHAVSSSVKGVLKPYPDDYTFDLKDEDGNYCKGNLHLYQNSFTGASWVWGNIQSGNTHEHKFGGCLVLIG